MNCIRVFCGAVLAFVAVSAFSFLHADTLPLESSSISYTATDWTGASAQTLSFPTFDSSLGTLDSVTLTLSGSCQTAITAYNVAQQLGLQETTSGSVTTNSTISVDDPGNSSSFPASISLASPLLSYGFPATGAPASLVLNSTASNSAAFTYTDLGVLNEFQGLPGTKIALTATTATQATTVTDSGISGTEQVTYDALTATVQYTYSPTAVPEPCSLAILGAGLAALMGFVWLRQ